jgi:hypothetical protein
MQIVCRMQSQSSTERRRKKGKQNKNRAPNADKLTVSIGWEDVSRKTKQKKEGAQRPRQCQSKAPSQDKKKRAIRTVPALVRDKASFLALTSIVQDGSPDGGTAVGSPSEAFQSRSSGDAVCAHHPSRASFPSTPHPKSRINALPS